jgi:hypothetical protein
VVLNASNRPDRGAIWIIAIVVVIQVVNAVIVAVGATKVVTLAGLVGVVIVTRLARTWGAKTEARTRNGGNYVYIRPRNTGPGRGDPIRTWAQSAS